MTSGIPFSPQEIDYIRQHSPKEFPSIIARGLSITFNEYNKGKRSKEAVSDIMRWIAAGMPEEKKDPVKVPDMRKGKKKK
jgi:hypothetical protein